MVPSTNEKDFGSPIGGNSDNFFARTPFSQPEPIKSPTTLMPMKKPPLFSPTNFGLPKPCGGCTLNVDESHPYPFCHAPFVFQFEGEDFCSYTLELPNCADKVGVEVKSNQRGALLTFEVNKRMMEPKTVLFDSKAKKGDSLYEAYVMWMREQRDFGDEAWKAEVHLKLPFKVEFSTYDYLPGTANNELTHRDSGKTVLTTCLFMFKACQGTYGMQRKVKENAVYICDFSDEEMD